MSVAVSLTFNSVTSVHNTLLLNFRPLNLDTHFMVTIDDNNMA